MFQQASKVDIAAYPSWLKNGAVGLVESVSDSSSLNEAVVSFGKDQTQVFD